MKKALKVVGWIVGVFLALDLLIVGLLFVPSIQTFVVHKVTESLSKSWGTEISIKDIRITPTLKVVAHEVAIKDHHNENMIYSGTVKFWFRNFRLTPMHLGLRNVEFEDVDVVLRIYQGEDDNNMSIWSEVFEDDDTTSTPFKLTSNKVDITRGRFVYVNDNERVVYETSGQPDIDYSFLEIANITLNAKDFVLVDDDIGMDIRQLAFTQYGGFLLKKCSGDFHISSKDLTFKKLKLVTDKSDLDMDLYFRYDDWTSYGEFMDSVRLGAEIRPSVLHMDDVADYAPAIRGMNEVFHLQADTLDGIVNDFYVKNIKTTWNDRNRLQGDVAIRNVADFLNARFDVELDSTACYLPDLAKFTLPGGKSISSNETFKKVGNVTLSGKMRGVLTDFDAKLQASTDLGSVKADLVTRTKDGKLQFNGNVASPNFNLAKLTGDYKTFGSCHLDAKIDGYTASTGLTAENLKTTKAHLTGRSDRFHLLGYSLRNITLEGDYQPDFLDATLKADDPNFKGEMLAELDLSQEVPALQGNISGLQLSAGSIGKQLPLVDTVDAQGFEKVIAIMQKNPNLQLDFDLFQVSVRGNSIDNINGYLGCDNLKIKYNEDSIMNNRLRLTTINHEGLHKYILTSNIANANFESSFPLARVKDSLQNIVHNIFPALVSAAQTGASENWFEENSSQSSNDYIKFNITTYNTRAITKLIRPDMFLASNSVIDVDIRADHSNDRVDVRLPYFSIRNKLRIYNLTLKGSTKNNERLDVTLNGDSVVVFVGDSPLRFNQLDFKANTKDNQIQCDFAWYNPSNAQNHRSTLAGAVDITHTDDIVIRLEPSYIYLKDNECHFNDQNAIHIKPHRYEIDNLVFSSHGSSILANGDYDTQDSSRLRVAARSFDLTLLNPLLSGMSFGGTLSADLNLMNRSNRRLIFGKLITDDLTMNDGRLGDLFLMAGLNDDNTVRFSGGLFEALDQKLDYDFLTGFSIRNFKALENTIANVSGSYENKSLIVKTKFDSLNTEFLEPFLSSFSDNLSGYTSGELDFYYTPDSAYLNGKAHVLDAQLGIAALGTQYHIVNQDIFFNKKGIAFHNMVITDKDNNQATLSGEINHLMFNDMALDLQLHTDRLLALNTPRTINSVFYGTGYVKGDVFIHGNGDNLYFKGKNIQTLKDSKIVLQVNSTNSASETDYIHIQARVNKDTITETEIEHSSTALNFDLTFNVTNDADVVLELESLGGTLNARADGRFQLLYGNDDLNLYGNLLLHSGTFKLSFMGLVNSQFTLVPGGYINFDGPLDNMMVNISAYKYSKTTLSNIISSEYLPSGSTDVNAYIHLNGPLMQRIEPTFSFELPNSSNEVRNLFYTAIDTQNKENMTKQFASFLVTNSFSADNALGVNLISGLTSGMSLLSNAVNNLLSNVIDSKRGGFGITYNQATETSAAEYGVRANANLLNNRMIMSTRIGYYDDRNTSSYNNLYGDLTVEYIINQSGTWRVKAFTYIGERDDYHYYDNPNNYVAGAALTYKQDFDTRKRNKKQGKSKQKNKKSSDYEQQ